MYDLYIFDKDQTLSSPFPAWARESEKAFRDISKTRADARGIDENVFFDQFIDAYNKKREATKDDQKPFKVTTWYWELEEMVANIDLLQPLNDAERMLFAENDAAICKAYDANRNDGIESFDGVPDVIRELNERSNNLAIVSDNRIVDIVKAMTIVDIPFKHFGAVICNDGKAKDETDIIFPGNVFCYEGKKPGQPCIDATVGLINSFNFNQANIVVIGDNKADGLLSKALKDTFKHTNIAVDFAWAKYGAALNDRTVWFNNELLHDPYPLGVAANEKGLQAAGIIPDHVLDNPADILTIRPRRLVY